MVDRSGVLALEDEVRMRLRAFAELVSCDELAAAETLAVETLRGFVSARACDGGDPGAVQSPLRDLPASATTQPASVPQMSWPNLDSGRVRENVHRAFSWFPSNSTSDPAVLEDASLEARSLVGAKMAVKANIAVAGWPTTACSALYADDDIATEDAPAIAALRTAGASFVGLTNMDELAWGGTSDNPLHGVTLNPLGAELSPSGSSGGSAVAVAEGSVAVALGTDTGGSVRLPAAACGVVGFRPSTGTVSSAGVVPLAESLDTVGVIGDSVFRVRAVSEVLMQQALAREIGDAIRVGILPGLTPYGCDDTVASSWGATMELLRDEGCVIEEIEIPDMREYFDVWFLIHLIEPSRTHLGTEVGRIAKVGPGARVPLIAGACLPEELEGEAQRLRASFNDRVNEAFEKVDFVLSPTSAAAPQPIGATSLTLPQGEVSMFKFAPAATWLASMAGLPAASVPIPTGSLPVGVQIMGARGDDAGVISFAQRLEQWMGERERL